MRACVRAYVCVEKHARVLKIASHGMYMENDDIGTKNHGTVAMVFLATILAVGMKYNSDAPRGRSVIYVERERALSASRPDPAAAVQASLRPWCWPYGSSGAKTEQAGGSAPKSKFVPKA